MSGVLCVTGASGEMGTCLIRRVADRYDKIVCQFRKTQEALEPLKELLGEKLIPLRADFSDLGETVAFAHEAAELAPRHFVHLAACGRGTNVKFGKTGWDDFRQELDVTFRSAVILSREFAPRMVRAGGGKLVYMLSAQLVWEPAKPYAAPYTCAKHALLGLMESLSAEYAGKGVTVNAVSPAMMDTKFLPELVRQMSAKASPSGRLLTPEEVAPAFSFLLSPEADGITGVNLPVTAGS